jgi:hypothetical protein
MGRFNPSQGHGCNISSMSSEFVECMFSSQQAGMAVVQMRVRDQPVEEEEEDEDEKEDSDDEEEDDDQDGYSE